MDKNEQVLKNIYDGSKRSVNSRDVVVSESVLMENGWEGLLPTLNFKKYENYWVRYDKNYKVFRIIKFEPWMENKSEVVKDASAPLPLTGQVRINLKDLVKQQVKDANMPKNSD